MIFDSLFGGEARSLENPSVPLTGQNLQEHLYGEGAEHVTPETAMRLTSVYAAIYVLSSSIAQLPAVVLRKQGREISLGSDHAAYHLLHDEPNNWQTSYKWRETKQGHVLGWGNGYTRIQRNRGGELVALHACLPWETTLIKRGDRHIYATYDEERPLAIAPEDMIHIRALGSCGKMGISPIRQHAEAIGLGLSAQRFGKGFFDGGGRATGLLTPKGDLTDVSWVRLKEFWAKAVAALTSSKNKTLLLPADLEYKALTVAPEDAQFIETRKLTRSEIAAIFNVPPHMIGDLEKATFSNISEQAIQFVRHTIMPWVVNWEQELNRRLFTLAERRAGFYVKLNLAGLMRGTAKERAEFYHYAITDGWMDRNEVRALEDLNPRDGLDEMLISVNARLSSAVGAENDKRPDPRANAE